MIPVAPPAFQFTSVALMRKAMTNAGKVDAVPSQVSSRAVLAVEKAEGFSKLLDEFSSGMSASKVAINGWLKGGR